MLEPLLPKGYIDLAHSRGISLEKWNPGSERVAWNKDMALQALKSLEGTNIAIVGGEVIHIDNGKLKYRPESWYVANDSSESAMEYVNRSHNVAYDFIVKFINGNNPEPLFVFGLSAVIK